ncbi:hypothetical protein LLH06_05860 [Mucilaginibacter daejeonensis]|uniref:hypothetical protein n=1 Tax=Mucilaginibacter daejeonensis TaxID=398049 RepID=UPI001D179D3F|nr:hypothetical protein [Mucilaginibacter daejeonensis]UEG54487.1 hypothetical protein LLH06_05860 [Mucilaginibacter daejeonensis]
MLTCKHWITFLLFGCLTSWCFAQETAMRTSSVGMSIKEKFEVLKNDKRKKHGSYQAYRDTSTLANGYYRNGERSGHWVFYDHTHKMVQAYNNTRHQLIYQDTANVAKLGYEFTDSVAVGDKIRYPVKIGGLQYGISPLTLNVDALARTLYASSPGRNKFSCLHIFTVGTEGQIKKHEVLVDQGGQKKMYELNDNNIADEYKRFIPGTINGKPAECKVSVETIIATFD